MVKEKEELPFPVLEFQHLVNDLQELDIKFNPEDLKKTNNVPDIYEQFLLLLGFNTKNIVTSELHQDSIQFFAFYKQMQTLLTKCGYYFTIKDINPTFKKLKIILSAMINFCKFRAEKVEIFQNSSMESEALVNKYTALLTKLDKSKQRVAAIRSERAKEKPMVDEIRQKTSLLTSDLRDLKKQQNILSSEIEVLKSEKSKITEDITNNSFILDNLKLDIVRLQGRIVGDPDKLLKALEDMGSSLASDRGTLMVITSPFIEFHAMLIIGIGEKTKGVAS